MNQLGELFDPHAELAISENLRPHWSQAGAVVFITFRTADSIPREVLNRWEREKRDWIRRHAGPTDRHWSQILPTLEQTLQTQFTEEFKRCRDAFLDSCHGECVLQRPEIAKLVADTLLHFDGQRYRLGDFVVMPNHVHLLVAFATHESLIEQCDSWLHYSARQINLLLGRRGQFWQHEPFDHLVRSPEQYGYLRGYIRDNGSNAGLQPHEYLYRAYPG